MKALLAVAFVFLLVGCVAEPAEKRYVVEEKQPTSFEVEEDSDLDWVAETRDERNELNRERALREDADDQELWEREQELRNVRRTVEGELERGYLEEYDDPNFVDEE